MGLFRKAATAATGMNAVETTSRRLVAEAKANRDKGMRSFTLVVQESELGQRNRIGDVSHRLVADLQSAGFAVVNTSGGGWDRVLNLVVEAGSNGPSARVPAAPAETPLMTPAQFSMSIVTPRGSAREWDKDVRLEVSSVGLLIRTANGDVDFEAAFTELTIVAWTWTTSVMLAGGRLTWEFAKAAGSGGNFHVTVETGYPGTGQDPTPAGLCMKRIFANTKAVHWTPGAELGQQLLQDLLRDAEQVPDDWSAAFVA